MRYNGDDGDDHDVMTTKTKTNNTKLDRRSNKWNKRVVKQKDMVFNKYMLYRNYCTEKKKY